MEEKELLEVRLTSKEAYEVMLHMLKTYYEFTGSNDLTDILSGGEYATDGNPADSAFWEYWLEAIEKQSKDGPLFKKFRTL